MVNLHDRLPKRVEWYIEKQPGDKPVTLRGKLWAIELDPCEMKRQVRPVAAVFEGLKKLFGFTRYFGPPVTPIDGMCTEDEAKAFIGRQSEELAQDAQR